MKIDIQVPNGLSRDARKLAIEENKSLDAIVEEGLRRIVSERSKRQPFKLRSVGFDGEGPQPEFKNANWESIRALTYEGRGG